MERNISRYELKRDHDGNIVSGFLAVSVQDGENSSYYEHWLTAEQLELVLEEEANLKSILEECFAQAELKMENEIATRPQPDLKPLEVEGKKEQLEGLVVAKDVANKKALILAEKEAEKILAEPIAEPIIN